MNTKLLKQKILDLAIRGKLTQQLKSDGTAADLLKEIADAKSALSQPKGKKSKDLGQIIPLDKSEAPFEIPANWEWVRLGDVGDTVTGATPSKSVPEYQGTDIPFLSPGDISQLNKITSYDAQGLSLLGKRVARPVAPCSVLQVCIGGSIGKCAVNDREVCFNQQINSITPKFADYKYIFAVFQSKYFQDLIRLNATGTATPIINKGLWDSLLIPLPPLAEQQRIVEKIQEAFAEIDSIENNKELLKTHIKQARQKILDLAIHGKLVPQNKTDEPASVLLERITRDNPHYEKLTDIPFEIPDSWEWTRLGDVCKPIKRGKSPKYIEQSNVLVFAQKCNQKDGPVSLEKALYLDESTLNKYPEEEFLQKGDVVINSTGTGTLGRVGYFNVDLPQNIKGIVPDSHVTTIRSVYVNPYYLYCFLKNKQTYLEENGEGSTNQKELKPHTIYDLEFPLPPLAEQKRIVDKIEEIFASLDEISLHLV